MAEPALLDPAAGLGFVDMGRRWQRGANPRPRFSQFATGDARPRHADQLLPKRPSYGSLTPDHLEKAHEASAQSNPDGASPCPCTRGPPCQRGAVLAVVRAVRSCVILGMAQFQGRWSLGECSCRTRTLQGRSLA